MKFDVYKLKGRIAPAIFSIIIPIFIFNHFFVSEEFSKFVNEFTGSHILSNLTISGICLYFLSEIGRLLGKNVFEKAFFKEELHMPTTNFLLFSDSVFSEQHKQRIREKIKSDFDINLPTMNEEQVDELSTRRKIVEVMALIRKKLHGNKFLLQHNIEYGAMRNTIGGSTIGAILSLWNVYFFSTVMESNIPKYISILTFGIYFLLLVFSKTIIRFYGRNYAKILYREYMG